MTDLTTLAEAMVKHHVKQVGAYGPVYRCVHCGEDVSGPNNEDHTHLYIEHKSDCPVLLARRICKTVIPPRRNSNDYYCGRDS